jgi:hypothetical protein
MPSSRANKRRTKGVNTMKLYVGLKEKVQPTIFEAEKDPSKDTHPQHELIYGSFKSREDAEKYVAAMDRGVVCGEG